MPQTSQSTASNWAPIIGIVLAGSVTTANAPGYWDPYDTIIGLILLTSLHFFEHDNFEVRQSLVYAGSYAFCVLMILGFVFDALFALWQMQGKAAFYVVVAGPQPGEFHFCSIRPGCRASEFYFNVYWRSVGDFLIWLFVALVVWILNRLPKTPDTSTAPQIDER